MATVRALPLGVALVRAETLDSYLTRLAAANHLDPGSLRTHLGMRTKTRPPDLDRLAALTGHPPERLASVLADACPPPGHSRLAPLVGRLACRRCTTARGIDRDVICVRADERLCRTHRRWLGSPSNNHAGQHDDAGQPDVSGLPEIGHAQRRHYRLLRRHGTDPGRSAIYWATAIVEGWTKQDSWADHRQRRLATYRDSAGHCAEPDPSLLPAVNYPEVVSLAALIADEHWRSIASADRRHERLRFDREVARRLAIAPAGLPPADPLVGWQEAEALQRRQRLHAQPGYHGPEVWLSQPVEMRHEPQPHRHSNGRPGAPSTALSTAVTAS